MKYIVLFIYDSISHLTEIIGEDTFNFFLNATVKGEHKKTKKITNWLTHGTRYCLGSKKVIRNSGQCGESKSEPFV